MKKELQILGAKSVGAKTVKVYCIPFTTKGVKEKTPSLLSIASGGAGIQEIMQEAEAKKTQIKVLFMDLDTWRQEFKNRLFSKISIEVKLEILQKDA